MFLETGGEVEFGHRSFDGSDETAASGIANHLVLDGQQRLTSAYQACYSSRPVSIKSTKNPQYRLYFFDVEKAVDTTRPISDALIAISCRADGTPTRRANAHYVSAASQYEMCLFPINQVFNCKPWEDGFYAYWDNQERGTKRNAAQSAWRDFRSSIIDSFTSCNLPVITIKRSIRRDGICRVYEKLNSNSVDLDTFDLLIAEYAAKSYDLRKDWYGDAHTTGIRDVFGEYALLSDIGSTSFIQAVSMTTDLFHNKFLSTNRSNILNLPLDDYKRFMDPVKRAFENTRKFMSHETIMPRHVPSASVVTAIATAYAHFGQAAQNHDIQAKMKRWFWCLAFTNPYRTGAGEMAVDVKDAVDWIANNGSEPRSISQTHIHDYMLTHWSPRRRVDTTFKHAVEATIIRNNAVDFATGHQISMHQSVDGNFDLHHIFPKKWCKDNNIARELYDSLVNKTPLSAKTNQQIGGNSPQQYLSMIELNYSVDSTILDHYLLTHGINPVHLRNNDFYAFFEERKEFLISLIERTTGKIVLRGTLDSDTDAIEADENDEHPDDYQWRLASRNGKVYLKNDGGQYFIVAGSVMISDINPSLSQSYIGLRQRLIDSDAVTDLGDGRWEIIEDVPVTSPTAAYAILIGREGGGKGWKDVDGRPARP